MSSAVFTFAAGDVKWDLVLAATDEGWQVELPGLSGLDHGKFFTDWQPAVDAVLGATDSKLMSLTVEDLALPDAARAFDGSRVDDLWINSSHLYALYIENSELRVLVPDDPSSDAVILDQDSDTWDTEGAPLSWTAFEQIFRFGDLYVVERGGDFEQESKVVGRFPTDEDGVTAAAAFVRHLGADPPNWLN